MRDCAKPPQVAVPVVLFFGQPHFIEAGVQDVEPLLALGAADQFADAGGQYVHRGHSLAVVIDAACRTP